MESQDEPQPTTTLTHDQLVAELAQQRQLINHLTSMIPSTSPPNNAFLKPPKPSVFTGSRSEAGAIDWIFQMEQYFDLVATDSLQQVRYAATFLRDHAATWWRSHVSAANAGKVERI